MDESQGNFMHFLHNGFIIIEHLVYGSKTNIFPLHGFIFTFIAWRYIIQQSQYNEVEI